MKKILIVIGICFLFVSMPLTTAFFLPTTDYINEKIQNTEEPFSTIGDPPEWATGYFYGVRGNTDNEGKPLAPTEYFVGYCSDDFKGKFAGALLNIDTEDVIGYTGGKIIGPFMLGIIGDNTDQQSLIVGLGSNNQTHFYFRTMKIVGPNNYLYGKYFPLE